MLYRKCTNRIICYTGKWTIWTYAIWESHQYDHMLYRKVNNIKSICYIGKWTIWTYATYEIQQYEHLQYGEFNYEHMLYWKLNNMNIGIKKSKKNECMLCGKVNNTNICYIGSSTIRTYALQESHQYKHMQYRKFNNMNICYIGNSTIWT